MSLFRPFVPVIAIAASTSLAWGHEFWIDPEDYTLAPGDTLTAAIRVGENFKGSSYAYIPDNFRRFDLAQGDDVAPVEGRIGDRPALSTTVDEDGLAIVVHVTRDYDLTYSSYDSFVNFVTHKDAEWVIDAHAEAGQEGVAPKEIYSRHAKSLVAVGEGAGQDRAFGLVTEIVALENPYTGDMGDGIDVQVFYQSEPRGDAQVEIFDRDPDGEVSVSTVTTDAEGVATVPVTAGHSYLVDAVVLRRPGDDVTEETGAAWESLWASLTFAVPE